MSTNCYICGRSIVDTKYKLRRKVKTGEFERRRYPHPKVSLVQSSYGMRIVCTRCAHALDQRIQRKALRDLAEIALASIALLIALLLTNL